MTAVVEQVVRAVDPRTGQEIGDPVAVSTPEQVDAAVRAAADAGDRWAGTPAGDRAAVLEAVAAALDAARDQLVELADRETALGAARLGGEVARTTGQLRMFAGLLREGAFLDAVVTPADPVTGTPDLRRIRIPIGVVGVWAASNFPFAFSVAGGDTASALAAGCGVVVKTHEAHPATSVASADVVRRALAAAGAPEDLLCVVHGRDAGLELIDHPLLRAGGFTGSQQGGRALADRAAARPDPIPFHGELGSVNPVFVTRAAAQARAGEIADGYVASLTLGAGQFCTNPGVLVVPDDDALLSALADAVARSAGVPMLTPRMARTYAETVRARGGLTAVATGRPGAGPQAPAPVAWTVTVDRYLSEPSLGEEVFGPAGLVVTYRDDADLAAVARGMAGALTATVHAEPGDRELVAGLVPTLQRRAGRLIYNGWPTGVAVAWAQQHGGPWPATTAPHWTSVGGRAIDRWLVPVAFQGFPDHLLPVELAQDNPLGVPRTVQPGS
ncbi:aldehyde dehydrogenase (NADP(+)) [Nakamurella endophytica]|uniref:Aldehyde dehydrogenase n=1 Tax=Nakamurella endophytica TaxID=1748367 RepID=A0A917WE28_9ACTN|nr:aldehyde dehydrogenase (NADP(+)) [Nakamurella endophytica]GGL98711.1 aldehyde dehydrogenase [Nakamurella endophytica]